MYLLHVLWPKIKTLRHFAMLAIKLEIAGHGIIFRTLRRRSLSWKNSLAAVLLFNPAIYAVSKLALRNNKVRNAFPSLAVVIELWIPLILRMPVAKSEKR